VEPSEPFITFLNIRDDQYGDILKKVAKWLLHQNNLGKLPKTKYKLEKAINPMCFYKKIVDIEFIKQHLIKEGYMSNASGTLTFTKKI